MGISVALVHEIFLPSRFCNLNSPHHKAGIVVGTPIAEYITKTYQHTLQLGTAHSPPARDPLAP